jgi:nucleotide-binding universal stress UspA family protein
VEVRGYHLLPRLPWRLLLLVDDTPESIEAARLCQIVAASAGARLAVIGASGAESSAPVASLKESLPPPNVRISFADRNLTQSALAELERVAYDLVFLPGAGGGRDQQNRVASGEIAARSPVPVLLAQGEPRETRRVLLCTAAGEPGKLDVLLGAQLARSFGAGVTLLYVERGESRPHGDRVGETTAVRRARAWIERHLEQGVRTLRGQGVAAESRIRYGEPLAEILSEAAEGNHDLIIVGGHVEHTYFDAPERDLAASLIHRADRPVLVVKGKLER